MRPNRALNALTRAIARVAIRGVARMAPRVYILTFMSYPLAVSFPSSAPLERFPGSTYKPLPVAAAIIHTSVLVYFALASRIACRLRPASFRT